MDDETKKKAAEALRNADEKFRIVGQVYSPNKEYKCACAVVYEALTGTQPTFRDADNTIYDHLETIGVNTGLLYNDNDRKSLRGGADAEYTYSWNDIATMMEEGKYG